MAEIHRQLMLFGAEELRRNAAGIGNRQERQRELDRIAAASAALGEPTEDDLAFSHSGLCQTCLPHARPASNDLIWQRNSGRFHLMVSPGVVRGQDGRAVRVGVPYGTRARLIMIFLQTEGVRSRIVSLGPSMSAWIRSLGLPVTGGPRGTIQAIREQSLRIARCEFTLQWTARSETGADETIIRDQRLVSGLSLWHGQDEGAPWQATVELTREFHEHLREHAVPLVRDAIAHLKDNSLGLDLYTLLAYRLQRLEQPLLLRWQALAAQVGSETGRTSHLAQRVKAVLPDVLAVYPDARVEVVRRGLRLLPSRSPVPRTLVNGFRVIEGQTAAVRPKLSTGG
ncbi:replication protein RepA [Paracraurococcus lichenis]|uniref:Replication protein RepA n=1 Tax=Paracraurococcus lichenis TaxID=3064888 RepID=A0ABT9EES1_9PROT|nr:replication protein RepA [Paracraurococcus sp. LOR1-02]MDO9714375.1 replication protein RepA [Paracraurococcus sp. LOR1-02]